MKYVRIIVVILFIISFGLYGASWIKEKKNEDPTKPVITSDREVLELPCDYEEQDLLEGLQASDEKDGDLTDEIMVGGISQFITSGECNITYVVFDSSNQSASLTRKLKFTDYEPPKFQLAQPLVFRAGEGSNAIKYVGASDMLEGDISSLVKLIDSTVNYQTEGEYEIHVEVTNEYGDVQQAALPVHIVEKSNAALQINLTSPLVYVEKGSTFDAASYIESVEDADGNLVASPVMEINSNVNTAEEGSYEVYYGVQNENGLTGETWLTVIVRQ